MTTDATSLEFGDGILLEEYALSEMTDTLGEIFRLKFGKQFQAAWVVSRIVDPMHTQSAILRARRKADAVFGSEIAQSAEAVGGVIWLKLDGTSAAVQSLKNFRQEFWVLAQVDGFEIETSYAELKRLFDIDSLVKQIPEFLEHFPACARVWRDETDYFQLFFLDPVASDV